MNSVRNTPSEAELYAKTPTDSNQTIFNQPLFCVCIEEQWFHIFFFLYMTAKTKNTSASNPLLLVQSVVAAWMAVLVCLLTAQLVSLLLWSGISMKVS